MPFLLGLTLGCTSFEHDACTSNTQCREAFGLGWTCGGEGFCSEPAENEASARCKQTTPSDLLVRPQDYPDAVLFGSLFNHRFDLSDANATALAVRQINELEGVDGHRVGLIQCSYEEDFGDGWDMEQAVEETSVWLSDTMGAVAMIGPASSSQTEATYYATEPYDTLIVSPSATSPALTFIDGLEKTDQTPGTLWRTVPPDSIQGGAIAGDVILRGVTQVAVIFQEGPYGSGLTEVFQQNAAGVTVNLHAFNSDTSRDSAVLTAVDDPLVEEVLFISSEISDITSFLNAITELSAYDTLSIFLADGAADDGLFTATTTATATYSRIRGSRPAVPSGVVYDLFASSYEGAYGESASASAYTAYAYDAAWLAIYGLTWALAQESEVSGTPMARGLRQLSTGETHDVGINDWTAVRASLESGVSVDIAGASGSLDYDPETEETEGAVEIWCIQEEPELDFELCGG